MSNIMSNNFDKLNRNLMETRKILKKLKDELKDLDDRLLIIDNLMEKLLLYEEKFIERKSISKKNYYSKLDKLEKELLKKSKKRSELIEEIKYYEEEIDLLLNEKYEKMMKLKKNSFTGAIVMDVSPYVNAMGITKKRNKKNTKKRNKKKIPKKRNKNNTKKKKIKFIYAI